MSSDNTETVQGSDPVVPVDNSKEILTKIEKKTTLMVITSFVLCFLFAGSILFSALGHFADHERGRGGPRDGGGKGIAENNFSGQQRNVDSLGPRGGQNSQRVSGPQNGPMEKQQQNTDQLAPPTSAPSASN